MKTKKVYIYHLAPRMHSSMKLMISNPPNGYEFISPESETRINLLKFMLDSEVIKFLYKKIIKKFLNPFKVYEHVYSTKIPEGVDLVYSCRPLNIEFPYVVEILDHPACLAGYNYNLFIKNKKKIEEMLLSAYCKKIITVNESSYKLMKKYFNEKIVKKTILIRAAIEKKYFKKNYNKKNLQILFIGSIANPDDFYIKGGLDAIESFKKVAKEFENIELIIRCKVPIEIKEKYKEVKNLKIIEKSLTKEKWSEILKDSDICLNLGHVYPLMATLEAMSYGIPIIMLDTWGVRDYLNDKNSILIKPSDKIKGYKSKEYPLNIRSKTFINEIKNLDEKVIERICKSLKKLIENPKLRERLGKNGKKTAETKFSISRRNKELKKVFDKALKR